MPTYISQEGLEQLKDELERRKGPERRRIADKIGSAKELGDLSENFEYHEAKEEQGMNEARVAQLESMIHDCIIVEETRGTETIGLGSTFIVECDGNERTYMLVGSNEANPLIGKISNESPMGAAFIGRRPGDEVRVETPTGQTAYRIKEIK
jgi:transcription elongation factor GreA